MINRTGAILLAVTIVAAALFTFRNYFLDQRQPTRILFIGNSLTSTNDLPATIARLADSLGHRVEYKTIAPGAATLQDDANDPSVLAAIGSTPWDFVVLQEQSQLPAFSDRQFDSEVTPYVEQLDRYIRANDASTTIAFFETWGFVNGDPNTCTKLPYICTYDGMQTQINKHYRKLTYYERGFLIPAGEVWQSVRAEHPEINLYADDRHPTKEGTYLAASVFVSRLFHISILGAPVLDIPQSEADALQQSTEKYLRSFSS